MLPQLLVQGLSKDAALTENVAALRALCAARVAPLDAVLADAAAPWVWADVARGLEDPAAVAVRHPRS